MRTLQRNQCPHEINRLWLEKEDREECSAKRLMLRSSAQFIILAQVWAESRKTLMSVNQRPPSVDVQALHEVQQILCEQSRHNPCPHGVNSQVEEIDISNQINI